MNTAFGEVKDASKAGEAERQLQHKKYEDCMRLLQTAGYFRARVSTLTAFDKVSIAGHQP